MRKIAANYIFLPGYPLVKNGYVIVEGKKVQDVIGFDGEIREIQGLEFYGGMLVAGFLANPAFSFEPGTSVVSYLRDCYTINPGMFGGLAILEGADLRRLIFRPDTIIRRLA